MSHNPYVPPKSNLTELVQAMPERPKAIYVACGLFGLGILLGLINFIPGLDPELQYDSLLMRNVAIAFIFSFCVLYIGLIYVIFSGRNWARWTIWGLNLFGLLWDFGFPDENSQKVQLLTLINTITTVTDLVACALLLFGAGGRWFSELKKAA